MVNFSGPPVVQIATTTGDLPTVGTGHMIKHAFQVERTMGSNAFTITVFGSLVSENGPWDSVATTSTNNDILQIEGLYRFLKVNVGTLTAAEELTITYVGL